MTGSLGLAVAVLAGSGTLAAVDDGPATIGDPAPPLSIDEYVQAPDGAPESWDDLEGRVVVLEFWATWCGPCIDAIPHLNELEQTFSDEDVVFIAISNEDRRTVESFLDKTEMNAWVAIDDNRETFRTYNVTGIPQTFLIDREGRLAGSTHPVRLGEGHLERVLDGKDAGLDDPNIPGRVVAVPGVDPEDAADAEPLFQVLIRKADPPQTTMPPMARKPGAVTMLGVGAATVIRQGYLFPEGRIEIAGDIADGHFALIARVPPAHEDQLRPMIRQAVEMTFDVEANQETRRKEVLVLERVEAPGDDDSAEVDREGRQRSAHDAKSMKWTRGEWTMQGVTMRDLADMLETSAGMLIEDETGLEGRFDLAYSLGFDVRQMPKDERLEAIETVMREQLGLTLRPAKRDLEYLVIAPRSERTDETPR